MYQNYMARVNLAGMGGPSRGKRGFITYVYDVYRARYQ